VRWALRAAFSENGFATVGAGMPILEMHSQVTKRLHVTNMQKLHDFMHIGNGVHNATGSKKSKNRKLARTDAALRAIKKAAIRVSG
jgi:hypothetical protein